MALPMVLVAAAACSSGADTGFPIAGTWLLDSLAVDGVFMGLDPALGSQNERGVVAWFEFGADGEVTGEGPCNDFAGQYRLDGGLLIVESVASAGAFCVSPELPDEALMDVERLLFDALLEAPEVHFSSEIRMQWQAERTTLTFRRTP